jgi:hypothetical protein
VHLYSAPPGVGGVLQDLQAGARHFVLWVGGVVSPREDHLSGLHEGADVVNVLVRFVVIDSAVQPDHLFGAQVFQQLFLYLLLRHVGIPPGAEQARLCGEYRALAVGVYRAALQYESGGVVHVLVVEVAEFPRHSVVKVPGKIQPVHQTAPGVEAPVHAADNGAVRDERGGVIPRPAVVAGHLHHADMRRQHSARILVLLRAGADGDLLAPGDSGADLHESLPGGVGAVLPGIRALREYQNAAVVRREFRRHVESVLLRGCVKYSHAVTSRLSFRTSRGVCRGILPS